MALQKIKNRFLALTRCKFAVMIALAIIVSIILVIISLTIYRNSGAVQLDLSRPGYIDVRDKATVSDADFHNFSSTGEVNQKVIDEFRALFVKQVKKVESADAFGGDPLNPKSLGIDADEANPSQ